MTTNQVLIGVGLILVLAVGSQVLASGPPQPEPGDTMVLLCPAAGGP